MEFNRDNFESISLLDMDEYNANAEIIPAASSWWWLKTPGTYKKNAMYVFIDGEVYNEGFKVSSDKAGVRPVIYLKADCAKALNAGDKITVGKYEATVLDNKGCLLDSVVCNRRFNVVSNDWETSELKTYIESDEFLSLIF